MTSETEETVLAEALAMTGLTTTEDLIDMANVGQSLMEQIERLAASAGPFHRWMPSNDPAEIVFDLVNHYEDAALSRAPEVEELGASTRMTSPASRSQTPLSAGQFAWISRPDVVAMLDRVAGLHADLALDGGDNARLREAMESAFTQAKYAVAFMPTAADQDTSDVRKVLGIAPIDPDIERRFGPPTYTEEQVKAYHAALSLTGDGFVYHNPDVGMEYAPSHPVESGEVSDATDIRASTQFEDWLVREAAVNRPTSPEMGEISVEEIEQIIEANVVKRTLTASQHIEIKNAARVILSKLKENGLSREGLGGSARASRGAAGPSDCAEGDARLSGGEGA